MRDVRQNYIETYADFRVLCDVAFELSVSNQGFPVETRELQTASSVFAKLASHAHAIIKLAPVSPLGHERQNEFWDLASVAILTRALVDTYYTMFYIAIDKTDEETQQFRWLLWDQHDVLHRLEKLRLIGSESEEIPNLRTRAEVLTKQITEHPIYSRQPSARQKKLRTGELGIFSTNTDLSVRAQIDPAYYKTAFMFLSSYVHSHPFSINQLALFTANEENSLHTLATVIRYGVVYLSLAVKDFYEICPNSGSTIPRAAKDIIDVWSGVAREFSQIVKKSKREDA